MNLKYNILFFAFFCGQHVAAQVTQKCWLGDSKCEEEAYLKLARYVIMNGIPELDIPSLTPLPLYNNTVQFLKMVNATLKEGECNGINTCRVLSYVNNATSFRITSKLLCARITINGTYTMTTEPYFCKLIGQVSGCGNVSIVAENWYFKFDYPYKFIRHQDGEIYLEPNFKAGRYASKVLKKFSVSFDKILVNGIKITEKVVSFVNTYWKLVLDTIGKPFHIASLKNYFPFYEKYYRGVPATDAYYDDLTQYL